MRRAYRVEQIRAAEAALMDTVPAGALMQRAATGLATACAAYLGRVYGARVLLLVGGGNNGGDTLYAGAILARRGARVRALLLSEHVHEAGLTAFREAGGGVAASAQVAREVDLVIDGILGIGGRPGLAADAEAAIDAVTALGVPVVAVDVPSGVDVDSGQLSGSHVDARLTVTFGAEKVGLLVDPASRAAGVVELVDIGLAPYLGGPSVEALQAADVAALLPVPPTDAQKYTRGVLGVVAGSPQYAGAALLVLQGAVSAGFAGMVRYAGSATDVVRGRYPEVVIGEGRVQAWTVGSGVGEDRDAGASVARVLDQGLPTVVDADGLRHLPEPLSQPTVLTPHAGELARMLQVERADVEGQMLRRATEAADRWQAVVLLKGARTVVAAPDGRIRVNTTGCPWLATAGAGDVLSGVVGSLLAAGLDCFDAASVGDWLHGSAATLASAGGPVSATAVAGALPVVTRALLAPADGGGPNGQVRG